MAYYRTALSRQVGEAVRIRRRGEAILNSRSEFNRCLITRLSLPFTEPVAAAHTAREAGGGHHDQEGSLEGAGSEDQEGNLEGAGSEDQMLAERDRKEADEGRQLAVEKACKRGSTARISCNLRKKARKETPGKEGGIKLPGGEPTPPALVGRAVGLGFRKQGNKVKGKVKGNENERKKEPPGSKEDQELPKRKPSLPTLDRAGGLVFQEKEGKEKENEIEIEETEEIEIEERKEVTASKEELPAQEGRSRLPGKGKEILPVDCPKKSTKQLTLWQCTGKAGNLPHTLPDQRKKGPARRSTLPGKGGRQTSLWQFLLPLPQPSNQATALTTKEAGTANTSTLPATTGADTATTSALPASEEAREGATATTIVLPDYNHAQYATPDPAQACIKEYVGAFDDGSCTVHKCALKYRYLKTGREDDLDRSVYTVKRILVCPIFNPAKITKPLDLTNGETEHKARGLILKKARIRKRS